MRSSLSSVNHNCYSLIRVAVLPEKFDPFDYGTKLIARMDEENERGVSMDFVRQWRFGVDAARRRVQSVLHLPDRRLCPIMDAKLAADSFDVHLDRGLCDINLLRDGLVRIPFNKAAQNQLLSSRK